MEQMDQKWEYITRKIAQQFATGATAKVDEVLFVIGLQTLGTVQKKFSPQQKTELLHVALCKVLEADGYYKFTHRDEESWPHFDPVKEIPALSAEEQAAFIKTAVVNYFEREMGWNFKD